MAVVNRSNGDVSLKIVYLAADDGAVVESAGDRSIQYLYSSLKPDLKGSFRQIPLGGGLLSLCDFRLPPIPGFEGHRFACHLYAPRGIWSDSDLLRMVLKGVDGIVVTIDLSRHTPPTVAAVTQRLRSLADPPPIGGEISLVLQDVGGKGGDGAIDGLDALPVSLGSGEGIRTAFSRLLRTITQRLDPELLRIPPDQGEKEPPPDEDGESFMDHADTLPDGEREELSEGEVEVPFQMTVGGEMRRFLLSIRIRCDEGGDTPPLTGGGYVR